MNINFLYKKLNKYKKKYKINKNKIKKSSKIRIEIEEGPFIDKEISNYIKKNMKYKYSYKVKYKNIIISIHFYSKENVNVEDLFSKLINKL